MSELKDSAIKLFGKTIQLLHLDDVVLDQANEHQQFCSRDIKKTSDQEHDTTQTEDFCSDRSTEELIDPSTSSGINDDPKTPTADKETSSKSTTKKENPVENANSEEKPQKPDKILPCPRCNSMDTKFCYYNNYNVNQPRHFCKNCQRYWTAGGTMRNTPVGSGRRKNKSSSSSSYYRHLIVSEALHPSWKSNAKVLNFGSNVALPESMNSALNFSEKSQKSEDDLSNSAFCSTSASNSVEKKNFQGYPCQIPCFPPPPPWQYPWNAAQYRPPPPANFPVSFYPPPQYWGCTVQVQPTPWSMPWITPDSPLGKHSRDGNLLTQSSNSEEKDSENGILTPKTLRISDPNEAAKSSLWSTLGISKEEHLHKAFQSKNNENNEIDPSSLVNLQANPAAMSRSLNFHETL